MSKLLLGAVAAGFGIATASAAEVETVVVTGSRIPVANMTSVSPINTVTQQEFQFKGATDVIDLLNDLPQNFQNASSDFSNTSNPLSNAGGSTTADLRGLGQQRTLVLINGRRLGIGDPSTANPNPSPDLDQIPVPLIERVEVLTGGASSTYGSDALAGVVNFIMKHDFEGLQVDAQYGGNWHDNSNGQARTLLASAGASGLLGPATLAPSSVFDGRTVDASAVIGFDSADGRGNVTGYLVYRHADPVTMGMRDFSACKTGILAGALDCSNQGSPNSNQFIIVDTAHGGTGTAVNAGGNGFSVVGTSLLAWPQPFSTPTAFFNSNVFQFLSRQDQRYSGGFFAHYDISPMVKPYAEFSFMDDRTLSTIGPSGLFEGGAPTASGNWTIPCNDPNLSAQEVNTLCTARGLLATDSASVTIGRRNIEGGGRVAEYEHTNFRGVVGVKGDLGDAWNYDIYGSYYYTSVYQANEHYLALSHVAAALNNCVGDPIGGCVRFDVWNQTGITQAQLNYLYLTGTSRGTTEELVVEGDVNGDLGAYGLRSPWASDGVQIALGAAYRQDKLAFLPDAGELSGDLSGAGGAATQVNQGISVSEWYGEARIPLIQKMEFADDLVLLGGIRFSKYSTPHRPTTWKVGAEWAPNADIRFRTSYDVAIRAASILEAYAPQSLGITNDVTSDPCAPVGLTPAVATFAQCALQGVTALQYGNGGTTNTIPQCVAGQCGALLGGNPALNPEYGKTFTVGFTFTPTFFEGFTGSVDYYDIYIRGAIGSIPGSLSMQQCLAGQLSFCSNIVRNPFNGSISGGFSVATSGYVVETALNAATSDNSGIDFQGNYHVDLADLGWGNNGGLDFALNGTYMIKDVGRATVVAPETECAGLFGKKCVTLNPVWRHTFRVSWTTPWDVVISPQWRYIGGMGLDTNTSQPGLTNHLHDSVDANLPAMSYLDLAGSWQATSNFELRAGMNNVLDTDPPLLSTTVTKTGSPNTYPTYDLLGRTVYVAGTVKF